MGVVSHSYGGSGGVLVGKHTGQSHDGLVSMSDVGTLLVYKVKTLMRHHHNVELPAIDLPGKISTLYLIDS